MAAVYPNYPFNVDSEGWPENVHTPPYPHEYYHDNGSIPNELYLFVPQNPSEVNNNPHDEQPEPEFTQKIPIRRHTPGSTDPTARRLSPRTPPSSSPPPPRPRVTFKRESSKINHHPSPPVQNYLPVLVDPDERPIKPMKDTSAYYTSSSPKRPTQPRKPVSQPKPVSQSKPVYVSPRYESDSYLPPPPSRTPMSNASSRRPVRTDLIPSTPFGIPSPRQPSRQVIIEEYADYPVRYARPAPKKVIQYEEATGMTTRERENYEMARVRRIVHVRTPPIRTVIYRA